MILKKHPAPTWRLTTIQDSSLRIQYHPLILENTRYIHGACPYIQAKYTHKTNLNKKNAENEKKS